MMAMNRKSENEHKRRGMDKVGRRETKAKRRGHAASAEANSCTGHQSNGAKEIDKSGHPTFSAHSISVAAGNARGCLSKAVVRGRQQQWRAAATRRQ